MSIGRQVIGEFKSMMRMELRDVGADEYTRDSLRAKYPGFRNAFDEYYAGKQQTKKNNAIPDMY